MEPLLREVCDLLAFDHAPVADEGDRVDAKPGFDLVDLCRKGLRILRIAGKDFDRDRTAIPAEPPGPVITGSAALAFRKH